MFYGLVTFLLRNRLIARRYRQTNIGRDTRVNDEADGRTEVKSRPTYRCSFLSLCFTATTNYETRSGSAAAAVLLVSAIVLQRRPMRIVKEWSERGP